MNKSKIEWCDYTWNPVTGCLHECPYCYARKIANRFKGYTTGGIMNLKEHKEETKELHVLDKNLWKAPKVLRSTRLNKAPYPFGFDPTFHKYRLIEPFLINKPSRIFVCSMADLFGEWVPVSWIEEVFKTCEAAPQHRYLFLTKNPKRYNSIAANDNLPPQHWYGYTQTGQITIVPQLYSNYYTFVSIEPLLSMPDLQFLKYDNTKWVIIGAETGNRKNKVIPDRKWIESIMDQCKAAGVPVFLKNSLKALMGDNFIQEWPEEMNTF